MVLFVRWVFLGVVAGVLWGVFLRGWMRLLVDFGEFSWEGTAVVVGLSAAAGCGLGVVRWARLTQRSPAFRLLALLSVPLIIFPQGIVQLLPAFVLGGLALCGRFRRPVAALFLVAMVVPTVLAAMLEGPSEGLPLAITLPTLVTLMVGLAAGSAEVFRPWPKRAAATGTPGENVRLAVEAAPGERTAKSEPRALAEEAVKR